MGRGIAATPDNLGQLGQLPTHPELLDWLAVEFREQKREGHMQAYTTSHCDNCHVVSKSRAVDEVTEDGGLAMLYALIGILIYVGLRFQWRFAVGAVAALFHDVLIIIGMFSLFQFEFDLTWMSFFMDAKDRTYVRYGGRDDTHAESHLNKQSLLRAMRDALALHPAGKVQTGRGGNS